MSYQGRKSFSESGVRNVDIAQANMRCTTGAVDAGATDAGHDAAHDVVPAGAMASTRAAAEAGR